MEKTPPPTDKIYSVSDVNALAEGVLRTHIGEVWVRGEISALKTQASGHVYFSLKDAQGVLNVALFKGAALRVPFKLEEGRQILVFGTLAIYSPTGRYQMVARFVLEEGLGRLQQEFERLKKMLEAQGLFARENKIPLPRLPRAVVFVTSPTGAVWHDFTRILERRDWRGRAILLPCRVQGAEAAADLVAKLRRADELPGVELIVVGRGGGSVEDLWCFNDERVVRAVAALRRPVISAVGHETDFTLCDFAADFRAETPSAAAELIAGFFNDERVRLQNLEALLLRALRVAVRNAFARLEFLEARLASRSPRTLLARALQRLDELSERLARGARLRASSAAERLKTAAARLRGLDPALTLERGYVLVRGEGGALRTRAAAVREGEALELTFADGKRKATL